MSNCLFCYQALEKGHDDFHPACSKKIFGLPLAPILPYSEAELEPLAQEVIQSQTALTGVQAKLSLHLGSPSTNDAPQRFTIVGLWGGYLLKPPSEGYLQLPEVEDLSMHLAQAAKIKTVPHSLLRMASGNLAYISKRIDRTKKSKLAMEDMCQLTERQTAEKYNASYEQIAKTIRHHSATPGLDVLNFYELVLFSFLTGNADMHLKNFSLIEQPGLGMVFSPAYDLVNTALVNPSDPDELALTLNGKRRKLKKTDFIAAMQGAKIEPMQQQRLFAKMENALPNWMRLIDASFLSPDFKEGYKQIIHDRLGRF